MADLLGFQARAVAFLLYKKPTINKYVSFDLAKRSGGTRTISAPSADLKLLQSRLATLLLDCIDEINKATGRKRNLSHGFERKRSIMSNGARHRNRRYVLNIDLADFFGTINFGRVRGFFVKDKHFAMSALAATVVAQIACHNNSLPQGSPCSPVISNLVATILDLRLVALASKHSCRYSRYADDITFSTNKAIFPTQLAGDLGIGQWSVGDDLSSTIVRAGFTVNATKTRMQLKRSRQVVTGLVVNSLVSVPKESRKNVRAMAHHLFTKGTFYVPASGILSSPAKGKKAVAGTLPMLHGGLGFIGAVESFTRTLHAKAGQPKLPGVGVDLLYRRFLVFTEFYSTERPVLLCEGKTDNVYIRLAIRQLAQAFPTLIDPATLKLRLSFFRYERTNTASRLGLKGGSGNLSTFIGQYAGEIKNFCNVSNKPVIIIVDDDDGGKPVLKVARQASGNSNLTLQSNPCHVVANLYLIGVPCPPGQQSAVIEDMFDPQVKATVLNGKTFNAGKDFDSTVNYGKHVFADKVITPNSNHVDFAGFGPLLDRIAAVIASHP